MLLRLLRPGTLVIIAQQRPAVGFFHAKSLCRSHLSLNIRPRKARRLCQARRSGVTPFGARILARGDAVVAREQGLRQRTVVVEYPNLEKATAAYDSPAYAEALKALGDGAVRDFRIVEG
jgi:uncharacterized protein (DUF1330 family)